MPSASQRRPSAHIDQPARNPRQRLNLSIGRTMSGIHRSADAATRWISVGVVIPGLEDLHFLLVGPIDQPVFIVDAS
jgi:hypothetical protein